MDKAILQYALAALAVVAMVVINLFGVESDALNMAFTGIISATVWGGVQRTQGIKVGQQEDK